MSGTKIWYCVNCGYEIGSRGRCHRCRARLVPSPLPALPVLDEEDEVAYRLGNWAELARGRLIVALIRANVEHRFDDEELVVDAADEERVDDLLEELQAVLAGEGVEVVVDEVVDPADDSGDADDLEDSDDSDDSGDSGDAGVGAGGHSAHLGDVVKGGGEGEDIGGVGALVGDKLGGAEDAAEGAERSIEPLDPTQASIELLYDAAKRLRADPTDMQADGDVAEASAGVFADDDLIGIDSDTWAAIGRVTRRLLGALGAEEALDDEIRTQAGVLAKLLQPYVEPDPAEAVQAVPSSTAELLAESTAAVPEGRFDPGGVPGEGDEDPDDLNFESDDGDDDADGDDADDAGSDDADGDDAGSDDDDAEGDGGREGDFDGEDSYAGDEDETDGGLPADVDAQIVYELPDWLPEQRANLSVMLDEESIEHSWDGGDLVIQGTLETAVDAIFDRIEAQDSVGDEGGEDRYRAIEDLFAAADRLSSDPGSKSRREVLVAASEATDGPAPVGMPDTLWWQIRARVRTLTDALDTGAGNSRIREDAAALRDLLRSVV
jgi:hypothetical protein